MVHFLTKLFLFGDDGRSGSGLVILFQTCRRPVIKPHAQGQPTLSQDILDFSQGFLAQVWRLEQLHFSALNQVTNVINALGLQAVGRTDSQLQIVDRTQQDWINLILHLVFNRLCLSLKLNKSCQLMLQNCCAATNRLFRVQGTVGFKLDNQLVQVGTLLDTSIFHHIGNTTNRAEQGVQLQAANTAGVILVSEAGVCSLIATTTRNAQLHVQRALVSQVGNNVVAVNDFHIMIQLDVGGSYNTRALFAQAQGGLVTAMHFDSQALEVQKNLNNILLYTFNGTVFVQYTVNLNFDHRTTRHGGQ